MNDRYFGDKWNFLDVLTVAVVLVAFVFRMMELINGSALDLFVAQLFLASAAPLLFSRVLFLSQAGGTLGPMTQVGCLCSTLAGALIVDLDVTVR